MIDVHMIPILGFDSAIMIEQLEAAGLTVHIAKHIENDVLTARLQGFSLGTHQYVTWVDPDDEILDISWIPAALDLLIEKGLVGVYPKWVRTKKRMKVIHGRQFNRVNFNVGPFPDAHHLTIVEREPLLQQLALLSPNNIESQRFPETLALRQCAKDRDFEMIPVLAYNWIYRKKSASSNRYVPINNPRVITDID